MSHQRIMIIGCGGSGKSTLARKLAEVTNLPLVHLDQLNWRENWQHISKEEFAALLLKEVEKDRWIIDGNYDRTLNVRLERCDTVIFLDLPRMVCIMGVIKRVITSYGRTRPDMGAGCPERFDFSFLKWIWNFNKKKRSKYHALLRDCGKDVHHIHSRKELPALIEHFRTNA